MFGQDDKARGASLAQVRRGRPMTQEALALAAGVSAQTVKRAEAGRSVSAETILAMCSALGITPDALDAAPVAPASTQGEATRSDVDGSRGLRVAALRDVRTDTWWAVGASVCLGALAFTPIGIHPLIYRLCVFESTLLLVTCATVSGGRWLWSNRRVARVGGRSWRVAGTATACVVLCLMTSYSLPRLYRDLVSWEATSEVDLTEVGVDYLITNRMVADDPAYDRVLDDFYLRRAGKAAIGVADRTLDTPGAWKARVALDGRCRDDYWNAPTYDHERCEATSWERRYDRLDEFVRAFVGGPVGDGRDQQEARTRFADHRYDRARAEVAARGVPR